MPIDLEVLSKDKRVLHTQVQWVVIPGAEGELGILPAHAPLLTTVDTGVLRYLDQNGESGSIAVHHGYTQVSADKVVVLSASAEIGKEIDVPRAASAQQRATEALQGLSQTIPDQDRPGPDRSQHLLEAKLRRAIARQKAAHQ